MIYIYGCMKEMYDQNIPVITEFISTCTVRFCEMLLDFKISYFNAAILISIYIENKIVKMEHLKITQLVYANVC